MDILLALESVLFDETKTSTYKFALITSIIDYIIENPIEQPRNGFHLIPIIYIAKRWLYYYYPLMVYKETGVKQGNTQIALHKLIRNFIESKSEGKTLYLQPEYILKIKDQIESEQELEKELIGLLIKIRSKIVEQPLRYIKIADNKKEEEKSIENIKFKETSFTLFGLINRGMKTEEQTDYQKVREFSEKWLGERKPCTWSELEEQETAFIQMGHYTYRSLAQARFFIKDAIIKRWLEFSVERYLKNDSKAIYALFNGIYLHEKVTERDRTTISILRKIAAEIFKPMDCIYCGKELKTFDLDHFIPWSKYPVDRFWNLFPACEECNRKKSDKLVELEEKIEQRIEERLKIWLNYFANKDEKEIVRLGGKEIEEIVPETEENKIRFLIEQLKEIHADLI